MGKILFFGSLAFFVVLVLWHANYEPKIDEDAFFALSFMLFAVAFYGYNKMALEKGEIGLGIQQSVHPRLFRYILYFNYFLVGLFLVSGLYLLFIR